MHNLIAKERKQMKEPKYKIKQVLPSVFCVSFKDPYDLCMVFFRAQEYYESGSKHLVGKYFNFFDAMKEYAKKYGDGVFSYPRDYVGYNLPSYIVEDLYVKHVIVDNNGYDHIMKDIVTSVRQQNGNFSYFTPNNPYYIIGVPESGDNKDIIDHELAHGLWSTNITYKKEMEMLLGKLPKIKLRKLKTHLKKHYAEKVVVDECHAYCATGLTDAIKTIGFTKEELKPFRDTFKKYVKQ